MNFGVLYDSSNVLRKFYKVITRICGVFQGLCKA